MKTDEIKTPRGTAMMILERQNIEDPTDREIELLTYAMTLAGLAAWDLGRQLGRRAYWNGLLVGVSASVIVALISYFVRVTY